MRRRHSLSAAALLLLTATAAHGQADLRYAASQPLNLTYVSADTMKMVMAGMPMGDMNMGSIMRAVTEFRIAPHDGGVEVTPNVTERTGSISTPMGDMPMPGSTGELPAFVVRTTGPSPEEMMTAGSVGGMDPAAVMGAAQSFAVFTLLPGGEVALGGTWTDTVSADISEDGVTGKAHAVVTGTYAADTTVNGRRLNVLRIETRSEVTVNGETQGMTVQQTMESTANETVLWDPALRMPYRKESSTVMNSRSTVGPQKMQVNMSGETRSVIQLQRGS